MGPNTTRRQLLAAASTVTAGTLAGRLERRDEPATDSLPAHLEEHVPELLERYDAIGAVLTVLFSRRA